ncbi:MAG: hypothetical protein CM15mP102_16110 [Flavobacteriales bacterium]|nr:MAG: hypothetical protein CM15mP102_16110 [Flavobacteriales bacterium]
MKIEAVLSGTLNYIFNNFQEEDTFHDIVSHAVKLGYTEPDPKLIYVVLMLVEKF